MKKDLIFQPQAGFSATQQELKISIGVIIVGTLTYLVGKHYGYF